MNFILVLAALVMTAFGNPLPNGNGLQEENFPPQPYSFNYNVQSEDGGSHSHQESGDGSGRVTGSYSITLADGRTRTVTYTADENGYNAQITTNELGTESKNPANVEIQSQALTGEQAAQQGSDPQSLSKASTNLSPYFVYPALRVINA